MAENVRLPSSSLAELKKIIQGYAHFGENVQLESLEKLLGIAKTTISTNNPALTELGLIEGGKTKKSTPLGQKLGRALEHNHIEDVKKYFQEIIQNNQFLSNIISTVRIKKEMTVDTLVSHILYASGLSKSKINQTGARTYSDLLLESGLLIEHNGQVSIGDIENTKIIHNDSPSISVIEEDKFVKNEGLSETFKNKTFENIDITTSPTKISINIQLQIPATENPAVYENLFKALRTQLLNPTKNYDSE